MEVKFSGDGFKLFIEELKAGKIPKEEFQKKLGSYVSLDSAEEHAELILKLWDEISGESPEVTESLAFLANQISFYFSYKPLSPNETFT